MEELAFVRQVVTIWLKEVALPANIYHSTTIYSIDKNCSHKQCDYKASYIIRNLTFTLIGFSPIFPNLKNKAIRKCILF